MYKMQSDPATRYVFVGSRIEKRADVQMTLCVHVWVGVRQPTASSSPLSYAGQIFVHGKYMYTRTYMDTYADMLNLAK